MKIEVTEVAIRSARACGMYGNLKPVLHRMARLAAPFTHPDGNYRFENYVLTIVNNRLLHVVPIGRPPDRSKPRRDLPRPEPRRTYSKAMACSICGGTMRWRREDERTGAYYTEDCDYAVYPDLGTTCDKL